MLNATFPGGAWLHSGAEDAVAVPPTTATPAKAPSQSRKPWGAETRSGRTFVLVNETAEELAPVQGGRRYGRVASSRNGGRRIRRLEVECAVWPPAVVVAHVDAEDVLELAAAHD